ncbi:MAG: hypothetical protein KGQ54_02400 [Verrucomicrobia bacterium]|nr:hypothetical protein [Verrucomicrobiota bacterium]NDE63509.1 hypothetical protein [Chlamydiota bacterium]
MNATTAALISSFEHMLTVYNGLTNLENLEKIERLEVSTSKGAKIFMRYKDCLLESSRFTLYVVCKEAKDRSWKKYALLSAPGTAGEIYTEKSIALHREATSAGIALKIQEFNAGLEKGYYSPFTFYGDLYQLVGNAEELKEETKLFFAQKIIDLVHRLHGLNIAHQDIKLENILVDQDEKGGLNFYVHNFNYATKDETTTVLCGAEHYRPMDDRISHVYDPKLKDLYSLGVLLFSFFTKKMWRDEQSYIPIEWKQHPLRYSLLIEEEYKKILQGHLDQIPKKMILVLQGFLRVHPFDRMGAGMALRFFKDGLKE